MDSGQKNRDDLNETRSITRINKALKAHLKRKQGASDHLFDMDALLASVFEVTEIGICITDENACFVEVNESYCELYGYSRDELIGRSFLLVVPSENRDFAAELHRDFLKDPVEIDDEWIVQRKDGTKINAYVTAGLLIGHQGKKYKVTTVTDITKKKQIEVDLLKFQMVINQTNDWVVITDKEGIIKYANDSVCEITGYTLPEIIGNRPSLVKSGHHDNAFFVDLWETIRAGQPYRNIIVNRRKNGEIFYLDQTISPLKDKNGELLYFVSTGKDITESRVMEKRLNYLAYYDVITDLPNRSLFMDRLQQQIKNAQDSGEDFAVIILDIAKFIYVNETFGTHIGDKSLQAVAAKIVDVSYPEDTVARLGDDEFGIICTRLSRIEDVFLFLDNLFKIFLSPFSIDGNDIKLSISVGTSLFPTDGETTEQLISKAEMALSEARKNEYVFFNEHMNKAAHSFIMMENRLARAIENDEFILYYQPYYDLKTNTIRGMESLIRWNNHELGLLEPIDFIPVLEETGLIKHVGKVLIHKACNQLRSWIDRGLSVVPVSINLSPVQLRMADLVDFIIETVHSCNLDPSLIVFEITESTSMDDVEFTLKLLNKLKSNGFLISIDDFGTGYSSLNYLKRFPVNYVKIDLSFVQDLTPDPESETIVAAIINLAHSLKLKTIAEGIETAMQLDILRALDSDIGQGYFWSRPIPPKEIEKLLFHSITN